MTPEQSISLFSTGFYIFLAIMVIGFGLAIFLFFYYRIPTVYALMTGRAQKKTIEKMQRSGQLRSKEELEAEREASVKSLTGGLTGDFVTEAISKAQPLSGQAMPMSYEDSSATTVLESATETTILSQEAETTVLAEEAETSLLEQEYEQGVTTPLNQNMQNPSRDNTDHYTAEAPEDTVASQYMFESTEHTVVIHTNEEI